MKMMILAVCRLLGIRRLNRRRNGWRKLILLGGTVHLL